MASPELSRSRLATRYVLVIRFLVALACVCHLLGCEPKRTGSTQVEASSRATASVTTPAVVSAPAKTASASPSASLSTGPEKLEGPAVVEPLEVPGDAPAWMVRAADGRPPRIVFLPGICSNAGAYLMGFPEAARAHGGAVAMDGDRPCGASKDFRSISSDPHHEEPRIRAVLRAAGWGDEDPKGILLVGYSLGATLIENLVQKAPAQYSRVMLIGSPKNPRLDRLKGAERVATMSCSLDVPFRMKGAVKTLEAGSVTTKYFEMPGCTHGNFAEPEKILGEALGWLTQ